MIGIDNGAAGPGWTRTGKRIGPNSHFYTANAFECEGVKTSPGWMYEALAFSVSVPIEGMCEPGRDTNMWAPDNLRPVYRAYNNRHLFNDSNYRYTTDIAVNQVMINQGWVGEGVVFCVP